MLFYNQGSVYFVSDKLYNNETINTDNIGSLPVIVMSDPKGKDFISHTKKVYYIDNTFNSVMDDIFSNNFETIIRLLSDRKSLDEFNRYILNLVLYLDKELNDSIYTFFDTLTVNMYPKIIFENKAMIRLI